MAIITQKVENLEFLTAENITVPHGFTTRVGGVSRGYLDSLNLGMNRGDDPENVVENYRRLGRAIGFDPEKAVLTRQTHSDIVRKVTSRDCRGLDHHAYPECDGLVTNEPGLTLVIFTADCTPILLHDPVTGAVGACHAGWRGTAQDIAGKTVRAMCNHFGCRAADIHAAIGPNIGPCHFVCDADVKDAMVATFGDEALAFIEKRNEKYFPDLKKINALALARAGVENIQSSNECTWCSHERFWSHRYTGGARGSQGAVIRCGEEEK